MGGIRITPVVRWLLIINIVAFVSQMVGDTFFGSQILESLALIPRAFFEKHAYWQAITYLFMHADLFHILFNMLILWMIGSELEAQWGGSFFLKYYFVCGISAGFFYLLVQGLFKGATASFAPLVGSSGAIYGLLVAYGIIYSQRVLLFMMIFPMKAKHFVLILAAIEFISTVFYTRSGIASAAHLGGMVVGFSYLFIKAYWRIYSKRKLLSPQKKRFRFRKSHLRLIVDNELLKEFEKDDESGDDKPTFH